MKKETAAKPPKKKKKSVFMKRYDAQMAANKVVEDALDKELDEKDRWLARLSSSQRALHSPDCDWYRGLAYLGKGPDDERPCTCKND